MNALNVIPMRPFESALRQARHFADVPAIRRTAIRAVLSELREGRNGNAIAGELQRQRLHTPASPGGGAA
jgi:hypothetical protein